MRHLIAAVPLAIAATLAAGCAPLRSHQGYVVDAELVNSVQPGVDNRDSVQATLGHPSFRGGFDQADWYYIARESRNYAFNSPRVRDQLTLQISFDSRGVVSAIRRSGAEQIASVDPSGKTTPTLGRRRGFFQDLFGNIGAVGSGLGGQQQGGSRDTP